MRALVTASLIAVFGLVSPLGAQTPVIKPAPNLPGAFPDTVFILSLSLGGGALYATAPLTLDHRLAGQLRPTQFRASKFADFHDVQWIAYPIATPSFQGGSSGVCTGNNIILIVAHLQVRAPKPNVPRAFVHSNIARDTTCMFIGG